MVEEIYHRYFIYNKKYFFYFMMIHIQYSTYMRMRILVDMVL